jgi:hypothetical protein
MEGYPDEIFALPHLITQSRKKVRWARIISQPLSFFAPHRGDTSSDKCGTSLSLF